MPPSLARRAGPRPIAAAGGQQPAAVGVEGDAEDHVVVAGENAQGQTVVRVPHPDPVRWYCAIPPGFGVGLHPGQQRCVDEAGVEELTGALQLLCLCPLTLI